MMNQGDGRDIPAFPSASEDWNRFGEDAFPGLLGMEVLEVASGRCRIRFQAAGRLLGPHGYLHGGAVVSLADTACGYGCAANLPEGATGFTTIELKANFLGTLQEGPVQAEATLVHAGRRTQVWDAFVSDEAAGRKLALFRCTQMLLYPEGAR